MLTSEIDAERVLRNVVSTIASPLRPSAMLASPPLSATLLPGAVSLPGAVYLPSPLLLPCDCLHSRAVGLLLLRLPGLLLLSRLRALL